MKKSIFIFSTLGLLFLFSTTSCNNKKSEVLEPIESLEFRTLLINDLLLPENKELITLVYDVFIEYLTVENNHYVFKLSKEEFEEKGIPPEYYDLILFEIKGFNDFFDTGFDANQMLENLIINYKENRIE